MYIWISRLLPIALLLLACLAAPRPAQAQCGAIFLNEIDYDQPGVDGDEFIELSGSPGVDLSGLAVHLVNGLNNTIYRTESLTGTMPADGFFVLGSANIPNLDHTIGTGGANLIQNGAPDGVGIWDLETLTYCDFINYEGTIPGYEEWPVAGEDSGETCAIGSSDSLARRGGSPLPADR